METSWPRPVCSIWARWHNPLYAIDISNFRMMAYSVPIRQSARSGAWRPAVVYKIVQTWPNLTDFPSHRKQGGGFCSGGHLGSVAITGSKAMRRAPAMRAVRCWATGQPLNKKEHVQLLEAEHRLEGRLSGREALQVSALPEAVADPKQHRPAASPCVYQADRRSSRGPPRPGLEPWKIGRVAGAMRRRPCEGTPKARQYPGPLPRAIRQEGEGRWIASRRNYCCARP